MVRNTLYWVNILLTIQYRAPHIAVIQYIYLHTAVILRTFYIAPYCIAYIVVNTALILLHIIKPTFNSLPGNQTSQFVDFEVPSTHSTLPLFSTSSHFINFILLYHQLYSSSTSS